MLPSLKFCRIANQLFNIKCYSKTIKSVHYENKKMFGAVVKKRKTTKAREKIPAATLTIETEVDDCSSEIYWLVQQKLHHESTTMSKNSIAQSHMDTIDTKTPTKQTAFKTKIMPNRTFTYIPPKAIPFTDTDLKSLLDYPMVCDKIDTSELPTMESQALPSVGKILQATMPERARWALKKWKLAKIAELGESGFQEYQQQNFDTGLLFHQSIENFLVDKTEPEDRPELNSLWDSVKGILGRVESKPLLTETPLTHPALKYKGVVDCVSLVQ